MARDMKTDKPVYIIAEAGVNHNGDLTRASAMIDAAAEAGADAVKFQTFTAAALTSAAAPKAPYQKDTTGTAESQRDMLRGLELSRNDHFELQALCLKREIEFLSTPFDRESLDFLIQDMKLTTLKIGSGDITNGPLLLQAARTGCSVILSTGMSDLEDVSAALGVLVFGYLKQNTKPSHATFSTALQSAEGRTLLKDNVTILHCTSAYPAPADEVNLRSMDTLREAFSVDVGLSDHTTGNAISLAAVARGACIIEKHFTLDRSLPGPDHHASLEPAELAALVRDIRIVETALGDGAKQPAASEIENIAAARKSLVAQNAIQRRDVFNENNLGVKRPGTGISPMDYWDQLGQPSNQNYDPDDLIKS
ncbi:N-acetylneuraminate synthase [bacterium]|nr:N-acetylneuraminate synthase [bacterium]